jgi:hypothetical protein
VLSRQIYKWALFGVQCAPCFSVPRTQHPSTVHSTYMKWHSVAESRRKTTRLPFALRNNTLCRDPKEPTYVHCIFYAISSPVRSTSAFGFAMIKSLYITNASINTLKVIDQELQTLIQLFWIRY